MLDIFQNTIYPTALYNTTPTSPSPTPAIPSTPASIAPPQPNPVELGEDHRFASGGEIGFQLEGGDPDHLPGGEETLVTPRPEPAHPLAAGGEGIEQAMGEQRDQTVAECLGYSYEQAGSSLFVAQSACHGYPSYALFIIYSVIRKRNSDEKRVIPAFNAVASTSFSRRRLPESQRPARFCPQGICCL
ncbi:hypothetical protein D3C71_856760 [compost metagenome]